MTGRHWHVAIIIYAGGIEADTAPEAEQQVRDNLRDYLQPGNVVSVDAERIGVEEMPEFQP